VKTYRYYRNAKKASATGCAICILEDGKPKWIPDVNVPILKEVGSKVFCPSGYYDKFFRWIKFCKVDDRHMAIITEGVGGGNVIELFTHEPVAFERFTLLLKNYCNDKCWAIIEEKETNL